MVTYKANTPSLGQALWCSPLEHLMTTVLLAKGTGCLPQLTASLMGMAQDIARLGVYVEARRKELGLSQADLAARGGPSDTTVSKIELGRAQRIQAKTARELDDALEWLPGSSEVVMSGGYPTPLGAKVPYPPDSDEDIEIEASSIGKDKNNNMEFSVEGRAGATRMTISYGAGSRLKTVRTSDLVDIFEDAYRRLLGVTYDVATTADAWKVGPPPSGDRYRTRTTSHASVMPLDDVRRERGAFEPQERAASEDDVPKDDDQ